MLRVPLQINGWCPVEKDEELQLVHGIEDFTLFFRVNVQFPACGGLQWNNANGTLPTPGWNLFTVQDVLSLAGADVDATFEQGGDFAIAIHFNCNLVCHCCTLAWFPWYYCQV